MLSADVLELTALTAVHRGSGLAPKRSTIDRILALRVLTEGRREFRQELLTVYIDLGKVFDSVNRVALWRILGLREVPPKLINLLSALYFGTESAVRCGGTISALFPVVTGARHGCVLAPTLFSTCMDWILGGCRRDQAVVHRLGMSRSLTLISQMMQSSLQRL